MISSIPTTRHRAKRIHRVTLRDLVLRVIHESTVTLCSGDIVRIVQAVDGDRHGPSVVAEINRQLRLGALEIAGTNGRSPLYCLSEMGHARIVLEDHLSRLESQVYTTVSREIEPAVMMQKRVTTQELFELRATIQKLVTRSTSDVSDHLQKAIVEVMEAATAAAVVEAEERWSKERGES